MDIEIDDHYLASIARLYHNILKPEEQKALRRFAWEQEVLPNDSTGKAKQELLLGFDDKATNKIVDLGKKGAIKQIANRVREKHGKNIINLCPKCTKLARTPLAKQCKYCLYSWHKK